MTKAYITFCANDDARLMVSFADGIKSPITELYHTDNDQSLLLWRTVVNGREVWERKVYKNSRNAEKALYARTAEYMEYLRSK